MTSGWPAESPAGGSLEMEGVLRGGIAGTDEMLGRVGGDGSGAGALALGDGAVVLGLLAVPTRAM